MASPDTIPCSCCDGEATHRGADGFYRCERHRLTADLAPFEVAVVESLRAQLDQCVLEREALAKSYRETVDERDAIARHRDQLIEICRRDSDAAHEAVLSGRANKLKWGAMLVRDAVAELVEQRAAANAQRDELLRDISAAVQTLREVNERSASPDEKRGFCSSAFCNGNHHDSACEGDYLTSRWIESMSASIARAQSGQPAQRDDDLSKHDDHCNCERCR